MPNNAVYLYGVVKSSKDWKEKGVKESNVFLINEGNFSAIVHKCDEKPYNSTNVVEVKDLILAHNEVLDKAMKDFGAVIPLSFNTINKSTEKTAEENLRSWLKDNEENLLKVWNKINGKKEYGIRIYYEKEKILEKIEELHEIKQLQQEIQTETTGIAYLLKGKIETEINELAQKQIFEYKQNFYNNIKKLASDITINQSKILLEEEKDLLFSISILVNKEQIQKVNSYLEKAENKNFYFNIAGPFAPYSFVNPQKSQKHSVFDDSQNSEGILKLEISETPKTGGFC